LTDGRRNDGFLFMECSTMQIYSKLSGFSKKVVMAGRNIMVWILQEIGDGVVKGDEPLEMSG
jgi:hypothetical protein